MHNFFAQPHYPFDLRYRSEPYRIPPHRLDHERCKQHGCPYRYRRDIVQHAVSAALRWDCRQSGARARGKSCGFSPYYIIRVHAREKAKPGT
ncbi:hypothetical protein [Prevotella sp. P4-51]|uniref:hypothetical protein n=1 Tax=Prevotella sp. P4-51 TaxID=2024228 RepID=UPI00117F3C99|nr:hypothetical protein [Prevotella sp. P4-51]